MVDFVPVIFVAVCWLLSWRRTPFAVGWLGIGVCLAALGVLMVSAADSVHHTVPGLVAVSLAGCLFPAIVTGFVEALALEDPGEHAMNIAAYRGGHRRQPRRRQRLRWEVHAQSTSSGVVLTVERGSAKRHIGEADPLADMDAFMDLRVRAEQAAETLNALKIQ